VAGRSFIGGCSGLLVLAGSSFGQVACPTFTAGPAAQPIVPGQTGTLTLSVQSGARFVTNDGTIDLNLMLDQAPNTCANFLNYVRSGRYNNVIFHRSVRLNDSTQIGVIQAGGFTAPAQPLPGPVNPVPASQRPLAIVTDPPIAIEHAVGNVRGTIAMARTANPVSATSQFFINTVDNNADVAGHRFSLDASPFDPQERPGYAVFGTVTPATMAAVDTIRDRTIYQLSPVLLDNNFATTPLRVPQSQAGYPLLPSQYVTITTATPTTTLAASWPGGSGWTYRWRRNGTDLADAGRISGSGTAALSISAMTLADSGVYECVVTGLTCSGSTAVSSSVKLSCPADLGVAGGTNGSDGILDNNDFIAFINLFFAADARADFGRAGGESGADGAFDNNDFIVFINRFFNGC